MATLTIIKEALTESGRILPVGTVGMYDGHIPGGMVRIIVDGVTEVIHPHTTKELSIVYVPRNPDPYKAICEEV